jgi:hypothetical protein
MHITDSTDDDTATQRLAELTQFFRERPVTGPAGHSYISSEPRGTTVHPAAPVNLHVVDHIDATVREIADYTREANPDADPLPERVQDVYAWCVENTETAPEDVQLRRDAIIFRQHLEHAIAMGDHRAVYKAVRPIRCPECRTLGLFWRPQLGQAICTNRRCLTRDGLAHRWTLERLAYEKVAAEQKNRRVHAT